MKSRNLICLVAIVAVVYSLPLFLLAQDKKDGEEVYTIKKGIRSGIFRPSFSKTHSCGPSYAEESLYYEPSLDLSWKPGPSF